MTSGVPRTFVSYSWDDETHREWVRTLASRLRQDGIDVTLDLWHAVPGDQLPLFMEQAIRENDFVLAICTPAYRLKFDRRDRGVGYEGDLITSHALILGNPRKFIPILRRGEWTEVAPMALAGKYYVDLRGDPYAEVSYQDLLSALRGTRRAPPAVGGAAGATPARASAAMPATPARPRTQWRYQVVAFDLDGTLLRGPDFQYSWKLIWRGLGLPETTHRQSMRKYLDGQWTYQQWCEWVCRQFMARGLTRDRFAEIVGPLRLTRNFEPTLRQLKQEHFTLAIVSGSVDTFLEVMVPRYAELFDYVFVNKLLFDEHGRLTGVVHTDYDFAGKALALEKIAREIGCTADEVVFVGEGFNDAHAIRRAGLSIAYPPSAPESEAFASVVIKEDDLSRILEHVLVV